MRRQSNANQVAANRVVRSDPAVSPRLYRAFLEMRGLLEDYAPVWYTEALHERAEAIIRDCSGAKLRSRNERSLRRQKLVQGSGCVSSETKRELASQAVA
jgi:hypothetical protein